MKRHLTSHRCLAVLLSLTLLLGLIPTTAFAEGETYDLWVGSTQVTAANAANVLGDNTVSYDADSNTLTLDGATLGSATHTGYSITAAIFADESIGDLTVHVTGENSIDVTGFGQITAGIYAYNSLTFEGDGSLTVYALSLGSEGNGVYAHTGNVTVNSGTYTFEGDGTGCYGIFANSNSGTVFVKGGTLTAKGGATGTNGVAIGGTLDFSQYTDCEIQASVNADGTSDVPYNPDNQNTYRLYKYIKITAPVITTPEYDENGFEIGGYGYQPAPLVNGVYQIGNAGQLFWFAQTVKASGDGTVVNGTLTNDITIPQGRTWTPIWVTSGTAKRPYTGTFDGAGHTISGLVTDQQHGGLFRALAEATVVKDLGLINGSFTSGSSDYVGSIAATNYGTVQNCYNTCDVTGYCMFVGGIVGENKGTIENCYNTGAVAVYGQGEKAGGICGVTQTNSTIQNCYNTGAVSGRWGVGGVCGYFSSNTVTISRCYNVGQLSMTTNEYPETIHGISYTKTSSYYDTVVDNCYYIADTTDQTGGKTQAQFASGEVTWLLNDKKSTGAWGQTIGTETSPVLGGAPVYEGYEFCYSETVSYSNDSNQVHTEKPDHDFSLLQYDAENHWYACANEGCTEIQNKAAHTGGTATYFEQAVCDTCHQPYGALLTDTTPPTGQITVGTNSFQSFLNTITFGLFFNETQTVTITADDDSCDHAGYTDDDAVTVAYYLHSGDTALTQAELADVTFTPYAQAFTIDPDNRYVIYAKLTDHAGNVTYLSSDGVVLDATVPTITGVTHGSTYYTTQSVTVADENLQSVTLNGTAVDPAVTLDGNVDKTYTIAATDKAGNTTTVTVTMKPIAALTHGIDALTEANVTSAHQTIIEAVQTAVAGVDIAHATQEEKAALSAITQTCTELLTKIETVTAQQNALDQAVTALPDLSAITSDRQAEITDLVTRLDALLEGDNLTEGEIEAVTALKNHCSSLLDKISQVSQEMEDLHTAIEGLDPSAITSADQEALEQLESRLDDLLKGENLTQAEQTQLEELKEAVTSAQEQLEQAQNAATGERIDKVENITSETVTVADKEDLTAAKEDLEAALSNFDGNYTQAEKVALQEQLEQITGALHSIQQVEKVHTSITSLPESAQPDELDKEALILAAQAQYDGLSQHEKSLVSKEFLDKLSRLQADLSDYRILSGDGSQWTSDASQPGQTQGQAPSATITMVANGAVQKFTGLWIDGVEVDPSCYTIASGSTIITLKPEYLRTLSLGAHTMAFQYTNGSTQGTFYVLQEHITSPQTGDSSQLTLWLALLLAAAWGVTATVRMGKRRYTTK